MAFWSAANQWIVQFLEAWSTNTWPPSFFAQCHEASLRIRPWTVSGSDWMMCLWCLCAFACICNLTEDRWVSDCWSMPQHMRVSHQCRSRSRSAAAKVWPAVLDSDLRLACRSSSVGDCCPAVALQPPHGCLPFCWFALLSRSRHAKVVFNSALLRRKIKNPKNLQSRKKTEKLKRECAWEAWMHLYLDAELKSLETLEISFLLYRRRLRMEGWLFISDWLRSPWCFFPIGHLLKRIISLKEKLLFTRKTCLFLPTDLRIRQGTMRRCLEGRPKERSRSPPEKREAHFSLSRFIGNSTGSSLLANFLTNRF